MKNLKANILFISGIIALSITLYELGKPLYNLWLYQPSFDKIQEIIDFFELPILIALLIAYFSERYARRKAEKEIEIKLNDTIDSKIKSSLELVIDNKLKPMNECLIRIEERVYNLNGSKYSI